MIVRPSVPFTINLPFGSSQSEVCLVIIWEKGRLFMADVMISYARADEPAAERLARRLTADGFDVWFDREIPPGQSFDEVIDRALRQARKVVVLWSRQSVGSRWVVAEAEEAASMAKLVPARLDDSVIPLEFRRVHAADLIGWGGDPAADGYRTLVATLRNGGQPGVPMPTAPRSTNVQPSTRTHHPGRWLFLIPLLIGLAVAWWLRYDGSATGPETPTTASPTAGFDADTPALEAKPPDVEEPASPPANAAQEEPQAPDISGDYYLDAGNPRVIHLESQGNDRYAIYEQPPAPWPFSGTVAWRGDFQFEGIADFDSGAKMNVVLEQMADGRLLTEFRFVVDENGVTTDRVDKHILVPVPVG